VANKIVNFEKNKGWINGKNYLGIIEEGSVELKRKTTDYDASGMVLPVKIPMGKLEPITAKLKVKLADPMVFTEFAKNRGFVDIRMSGLASVFNSTQGYVYDENITTRIRGFTEEIPTPNHKDGEIGTKDLTINVWFLEISRNGIVILKVDATSGEIIPRDLV